MVVHLVHCLFLREMMINLMFYMTELVVFAIIYERYFNMPRIGKIKNIVLQLIFCVLGFICFNLALSIAKWVLIILPIVLIGLYLTKTLIRGKKDE